MGDGKMRFMITAKVRTDPVSQFLRCEQAGRLDDLAFAMRPVRLDKVPLDQINPGIQA